MLFSHSCIHQLRLAKVELCNYQLLVKFLSD